MKKQNAKQLNWSRITVESYIKSKLMMFVAFLAFAFFTPSAVLFAQGDQQSGEIGVTIAAVGMMAIGNIETGTGQDAASDQVKAKLWILEADQYDDDQAFPARNGREVGTIPLRAGEKWHYIKSVENSPKPNSKGELTDMGGSKITNDFPFIVGGMADNLLDFLENGIGESYYIVWEICATGKRYLIGDGCKPVRLMEFEGGAGENGTGYSLKFQNQCGKVYSTYVGTTEHLVESIVAEDAVAIPIITGNDVYKLTDGTAASVEITTFSGVAVTDIGRILTIKGTGGDNPSTIGEGNDFILVDGAEWTATLGATLTVKVYKDGAASYKFIEQSRT